MKALLFWLMGMTVVAAWGHSCDDRPPMCQRYGEADGIFLVKVLKIHRWEPAHQVQHLMEVLERFKGVRPEEKYIVVAESIGFRSFENYEIGGEYLIFASKLAGDQKAGTEWLAELPGGGRLSQWRTGMCAFNEFRDEQSPNLQWLRKVARQESGATVWGKVWQREPGRGQRQLPQTSAKVVLKGEKGDLETHTGEGNDFLISGVPFGRYEIWAESSMGQLSSKASVDLNGTVCELKTLYMNAGGGLSGRVWRDTGEVASALKLQLVRFMPDGKLDRLTLDETETDESGGYSIHSIPAGDYLVGVGIVGPASDTQPWETRMERGRPVEATAKRLTVREGGIEEGVSWTLPAALRVRELTVHVQRQGRRAEWPLRVEVTPQSDKSQVIPLERKTEQGEARMRVIASYGYEVFVHGGRQEGDGWRWWRGRAFLAAGTEAATVEVELEEILD